MIIFAYFTRVTAITGIGVYQTISNKGVWLQSANLVHVTETRKYISVSHSPAESSFSQVFRGFLELCRIAHLITASSHDFGERFVQTLK